MVSFSLCAFYFPLPFRCSILVLKEKSNTQKHTQKYTPNPVNTRTNRESTWKRQILLDLAKGVMMCSLWISCYWRSCCRKKAGNHFETVAHTIISYIRSFCSIFLLAFVFTLSICFIFLFSLGFLWMFVVESLQDSGFLLNVVTLLELHEFNIAQKSTWRCMWFCREGRVVHFNGCL